MIHAFNFTCQRDLELSELMVRTFQKHCPSGSVSVTNTDTSEFYRSYGNGSGWPASMMKVKAMADILKTRNVADDDFILSVDSDVVFTSPEVFKYVVPEYGIIGTKHRPDFHTRFGQWSHMSGALIFLRGDIAKKIVALDEPTTTGIRFQQFKPFRLTENEDVVLSYLAKFVGASHFDLGTVLGLSSGNFEEDVNPFRNDTCDVGFCSCQHEAGKGFKCFAPHVHRKSFYHLNYCPTFFMGEPVTGKWMIPGVLKQKGIEL